MQPKLKTVAAVSALPILGLGWYLFRPELLFINSTVDEKLPISASQKVEHLTMGSFDSYAHETTGKAEVLLADGKTYLRLSNFKTSNGPDVHVYLVKGGDPKTVNDGGFLDLGAIKGNIGDQNYEVPTGTNLSDYQSVTIWCKRFSVGFGGAKLTGATALLSDHQAFLASFRTYSAEIKVTGGSIRPDTSGVRGSAELIEKDGKRFLRLKNVKAPAKQVEFYLAKVESLPKGADFNGATKLNLGAWNPKTSTQEFPISKEIDAWLYRTVILVDSNTHKAIGVAELRSDQERAKSHLFI